MSAAAIWLKQICLSLHKSCCQQHHEIARFLSRFDKWDWSWSKNWCYQIHSPHTHIVWVCYFPAILNVCFLAERWDWVGSQHCLWEISFAICNYCNNEKMIFTQSYLSTNGGSNNLTRGWVRRKLSHTLIGKIWERGCLFISEIRFGIVYLVTFN